MNMYNEIAKEVIDGKKIRFAVKVSGKKIGSNAFFNASTDKCIQNNGFSDKIINDIQNHSLSGIMSYSDSDNEKQEIFIDTFSSEPELVILGGGHVAVPVCKLAHMVGFKVTVIEDRKELADRKRFPDAVDIICESFDNIAGFINKQSKNTSYVIVTRGHEYDQMCLETVLRHDYIYVGVIGSKKKVASCRSKLEKHGFSNADIAAVHMPIGLDIGAQTPEEISVSIIAEIIQEKSRKQVGGVSTEIWKWILDNSKCEEAVLATIIEKNGSAPRGVGSRMLCLKDGRTIGTIGGGVLEYAVIKESQNMSEDIKVKWFNLSNSKSAELGMICGGSVRVLLTKLM